MAEESKRSKRRHLAEQKRLEELVEKRRRKLEDAEFKLAQWKELTEKVESS